MKTVLKCYLVNSRRVKVKVRLHVLMDVFKLPTDAHTSGDCQLLRGLCFLGFVSVHSARAFKKCKGMKPSFSKGSEGVQKFLVAALCAQFR